MRATAAVSEHPLAAHAVGEVAGTALEILDAPVDLALVFVEGSHTGAIEDIGPALGEILAPGTLVGATACGVIAQDREVEDRSAISLWAASGISAKPIRIESGAAEPVGGWAADSGPVVLLADPFTLDVTSLLGGPETSGLRFHGGFASAAQQPGGNRLILDDGLYVDGAVGVHLSGVDTATIVSQGCRPIGDPYTVTGVTGNVITELGSKTPMDRLRELVERASPDERELLSTGLQIGVVIDEGRTEFDTGDFLIRGLLGADQNTGALAIGAAVPVGTTLQFHVRDASTADVDLRDRLAGTTGSAALVFTCNGRGERLFGRPDHDAELVHELTGSTATAGMFCAGELGPVNGANHVHGFTASTLVFTD